MALLSVLTPPDLRASLRNPVKGEDHARPNPWYFVRVEKWGTGGVVGFVSTNIDHSMYDNFLNFLHSSSPFKL